MSSTGGSSAKPSSSPPPPNSGAAAEGGVVKPKGMRMKLNSDPKAWLKAIRHKTPTLLEVGRTPPKCVLSFGGAGFLCTYSLGVALFLQREKPKLVAESYLLGSGTGVFPAMALACGPQICDIEKLRDHIVSNTFQVWHEPSRVAAIKKYCDEMLPDNVAKLLSGRCCISVGMSFRDSGFYHLAPEIQLYGAHIATFDDKADVTELVLAATAPNNNSPHTFRGAQVVRGSMRSLSSELDQYVRHVYIHGVGGRSKSSQYTRHRVLIGRHGFLANTHYGSVRQLQLAAWPILGGKEALKEAFDKGFHDARRYERWEEDPYHFAKPDRSPGGDTDWRDIRAAVWGDADQGKSV